MFFNIYITLGAINGSCANFIKNNRIGYACQSGDAEALVGIVKKLDIKELKNTGAHSKNIYQSKSNKSYFVKTILSELQKIIN